MKLQTKCTLVIIGLLIIEILPVPFASLYSLYAIRKRPDWLPRVTHNLYGETLADAPEAHNPPVFMAHDPLAVRKNCTAGLVAMFIVDLLVPVVIPTALYVVRRRPKWFKSLIVRLYSDKFNPYSTPADEKAEPRILDPGALARMEQKFADLEQKNVHFAKAQSRRSPR
ncbi:hypothetical protein CRENPOLYSF2_500017 [Crenothrix polyspora]|uniref:Transmembrane protein n=1 Tax=Crenothrix polyspora TaxID=360316 RepID=A0A1R4HHA5_9GAMM|nr:hypothetical protein [Crenothrix polyspora]SJM95260.1 hypothetical protein CRENPOLYSF2_500017 [Crenothrix polyspora]